MTSSSRSTKHLPLPPAVLATAGGVATGEGAGSDSSCARSAAVRVRGGVVAEAQRERRLGAGDRAGERGRLGVLEAGDGAGGVDAVGELVGHEAAGRLVVAGRGAGLQEQRGRGHRAAGDGDEVADDAAVGAGHRDAGGVHLGEHRGVDGLATGGLDHRGSAHQRDPGGLDGIGQIPAAGVGTQVGHGLDADAGRAHGQGRLEAAVTGGGDDRALAGLDRVERDQPADAAAQHDAGQVVVLEDERLLHRPGRGDVAARPHLVERVALPDGDDPVEEPQRRSRGEDLDAGLAGAGGEVAGVLVPTLGEQFPARAPDPRRRGRRRRRARPRRWRPPGRRRRRRARRRRSGGGGTRCATRGRPAWPAACPGPRRCAGTSRTAATGAAAG